MNKSLSRRAFVGAGCALPALSVPAFGQTAKTTLRVSTVFVDGAAQPLYAQELGYFADQGLDVQISPSGNGAAGITAVVGGAVDIGISSVVQMASALLHGVDLKYVAPGALALRSSPTGGLVVAADSTIAAPRDFEGQTIGVAALRDATHLAAMAYLIKGGADPGKVSFVEVPFPAMLPAVAAGRLAGAVSIQPFLPAAGDPTRILASAFDSIADRYMVVGYFVSGPWVAANRAAIRRFATAMREAARWGNDPANRARSAQIIEKIGKVPAAVTQRFNRSTYGEVLEPATIDPLLEWENRLKWTDRLVRAREMIVT